MRGIRYVLSVLLTSVLAATGTAQQVSPSCTVPIRDFSGLAWLEGDTFLAVHDAKNPAEKDWPRVSLLQLPVSADGISCTLLDITWPEPKGASHDLESIARIPGSRSFLLAESGDDGTDFQRFFLVTYQNGTLRLRDVIQWPVPVENVEGIAMAQAGEHFVFLFAERTHGSTSAELNWATVTLDPVSFGMFQRETLQIPDAAGPDFRPVSSLTVDSQGRIYAASATDPDHDNGPFSSTVWEIGLLKPGENGQPVLELSRVPGRLATLEGLKVESLAVREQSPGAVELFIGTDDENYGAVIRPLRLPDDYQGDGSQGIQPEK